jgi:hypothetical protein
VNVGLTRLGVDTVYELHARRRGGEKQGQNPTLTRSLRGHVFDLRSLKRSELLLSPSPHAMMHAPLHEVIDLYVDWDQKYMICLNFHSACPFWAG